MKITFNPFGFIKTTRAANKRLLEMYQTDPQVDHKEENLIDSFVSQGVNPRALNKRIRAYQMGSYGFMLGAIAAVGTMILAESQGIKFVAFAHMLTFIFGFWVMQFKAYTTYKFKDIKFLKFVMGAGDIKLFSKYRLTKKQLIKIFDDNGHGDYAKKHLKG